MPRRRPKPSAAPGAVFVDSSALIAYFSADDANHAHAAAGVRRAAAERAALLTSNLVLAEVHRLLLFRAGIRAAAAALSAMTRSHLVRIHYARSSDHLAAHGWIERLGDQVITLTDAVSFAIMTAERCRVALSFDRDFWIAGFEPWQAHVSRRR